MSSPSPIILLVDDDPNDVFFMKRALDQAGIQQEVRVVGDGQEAIRYLDGAGPYGDRSRHPVPCLVLLDIKMPKTNGLEVLRWLRRHRDLGDLPVCMVTSSDEPEDRREAQSQGVEAYCVKPVSFEDLVQVARQIRVEAEDHCGNPRSCPGNAAG